jgi:hypothetical protein
MTTASLISACKWEVWSADIEILILLALRTGGIERNTLLITPVAMLHSL